MAFLTTDQYLLCLHFQKSLKRLWIIDYFHTNSIFIEEKFEFRKNLTADEAMYELINEIVSAPNGKLIVGGIFCDLTRSFGCVHHDILLSILNFYGITGKAYE